MSNPYRLPSGSLAMSDAMPFCQKWSAQVDRPLATLDLSELFANVQSMIRPGDEITVCAFEDNKWAVVKEVGRCWIVGFDQDGPHKKVRAVWDGPAFVIPEHSVAANEPQPTAQLKVKKEYRGGFNVVDENDNVIEGGLSKADAEAIVERNNAPA